MNEFIYRNRGNNTHSDIYLNNEFINTGFSNMKYKSEMHFGDILIYNTKHFNKFQKIMFKLCFGCKIIDIKNEGKLIKNE
jgi:hypothetical protein